MATHLITGGCGFIGSHLVKRLLELGEDVTVLDNNSTGKRKVELEMWKEVYLQFEEPDMLLLLIYHGLWEHSLNHLVGVVVWFV